MKKSVFFISLALSSLFFSCKFTMPSGLGVKTKAKYNFCIANVDQDLSEKISSVTALGGDNTVKVRFYNPDGKSQTKQLLIQKPLQQIPLDFSAYLDSFDLSSQLQGMSKKIEYTIPSVNFETKSPIELGTINNTVNALATFTGVSGTDVSGTLVAGSSGGFSTIKYTTGTLVIECVQPNGATVRINNEDGLKGTFRSNKAEIDLSGTTLSSSLEFDFDGGTDNIPFAAYIKTGSKLSEVTGLDLAEDYSIPVQQSFAVPKNDTIKKCVIKTGSLDVTTTMPGSWTGVSIDLSGALSGGLDVSLSSTTTSLNDKEFKQQNIKLDGEVTINFTNATISFDGTNPEVKVKCEITEIKEVTVFMGQDYTDEVSLTQPVPSEMKTMVSKIVWKPSGLKYKIASDLPSGNTVALDAITCNLFSLEAETDDGPYKKQFCADEAATDLSSITEFKFGMKLILPGWNGTDHTITMTGVVPNTKYSVDIEVIPVFEWYKIDVNLSALTGSGAQSGDFDTTLNLSKVFESMDTLFFPSAGPGEHTFGNSVELKNVPFYLFANFPPALSKAKFEGKIYSYVNASNKNYILGNAITSAVLEPRAEPTLVEKNGEVITNLGAPTANFAESINATSGSLDTLKLNYELEFSATETGAVTFVNKAHATAADRDNPALIILETNDNNNISLSAIVVLPFDFNLTQSIDNIDILGLANMDRSDPNWDIFSRSEKPSTEDMQKFYEAVKTTTITYQPTQLPFGSDRSIMLEVVIPKYEEDPASPGTYIQNGYIFNQNLDMSGGSISLNPSEIFNAFPLQPTLKIKIGTGRFYIPHDMSLKTNILLGIETDGTIDIVGQL